jgi:hypothetical protein
LVKKFFFLIIKDIRLDDAEDGELTDGTEKRLKNIEKEPEVNTKRILNTTSKKVAVEKKPLKKEDEFLVNSNSVKTKLNDDLFGVKNNNEIATGNNDESNEELDDFEKLLKQKAQKLQINRYNNKNKI